MGLVTADISVSLDLVGAGHDQSREHPFGPHVGDDCTPGCSSTARSSADEIAAILDAGAYVMGRHMFGPDRGEWDLEWKAGGAPSRPTARPSSWSAPDRGSR